MVFPLPGPPQTREDTPFGMPVWNSSSSPGIPVRTYLSSSFFFIGLSSDSFFSICLLISSIDVGLFLSSSFRGGLMMCTLSFIFTAFADSYYKNVTLYGGCLVDKSLYYAY